MHELASCFCPYRLYPHDTLCTYGAKQLQKQGFSGLVSQGKSFPFDGAGGLGGQIEDHTVDTFHLMGDAISDVCRIA